jgi:hypothetical protein
MKAMSLFNYALAGLITVGATLALRAADAPTEPEKKTEPGDLQKMTPAERQTKAKELREKFQQMTPEQRETLRKVWRERVVKKVEELKKKKSDGTITEQETKRLDLLEQRLKTWDQPPAGPGEKPADKPADKPEEKK